MKIFYKTRLQWMQNDSVYTEIIGAALNSIRSHTVVKNNASWNAVQHASRLLMLVRGGTNSIILRLLSPEQQASMVNSLVQTLDSSVTPRHSAEALYILSENAHVCKNIVKAEHLHELLRASGAYYGGSNLQRNVGVKVQIIFERSWKIYCLQQLHRLRETNEKLGKIGYIWATGRIYNVKNDQSNPCPIDLPSDFYTILLSMIKDDIDKIWSISDNIRCCYEYMFSTEQYRMLSEIDRTRECMHAFHSIDMNPVFSFIEF